MASERRRLAALLCALVFLVAASPARAQLQTGMDLVTGVGYETAGAGPYVLMGTKLTARGSELGIGLHLSNVLGPVEGAGTVTLGLEGEWERIRMPFYYVGLNANAYLRQQGDAVARNLSLRGQGVFGNVRGHFAVGYVERRFASFPWDRDDLADVVPDDHPYIYLEGGMGATVLPSIGLRWAQDVAWQRYLDANVSSLALATGPEARMGMSRVALQGGVVIGPDHMKPLGRLTYQVDSEDYRGQLRLSVETTSLSGGGPVFQGSYMLDGDWWRVQALVRLERDHIDNPTIYFSIQPKF